MVTSNALQRVFRLRWGSGTGTCFAIDVAGKQYLVTAQHCVSDFESGAFISIQHNQQWINIPCALIGFSKPIADIAVLAAPLQLAPTLPLEPTCKDSYVSQQCWFLGFPCGIYAEVGEINSKFPLPLVKSATISAMITHPSGLQEFLLDGHNNAGFSGGPVVFYPRGSSDLRVAAVVSGYRSVREQVLDAAGEDTGLTSHCNTGIISSHVITHAVALINNNPAGFVL